MKLAVSLAASGLCLALGVWSGNAHAGLDSCGNIDVEASAECKVEVEGGCTAHCEPPQVRLACAGKLEASCEGECSATAQASCTAECDVSACEAKCTAKPAEFNCSAQCQVDADAHCAGECMAEAAGSEARARCTASCKATMSAECDASCQGQGPEVDCKARCEASCKGSCTGEARANCQVDCQSKGFVKCEGDLKLDCEAQCTKPEGALFCDGQYVDHGGNLEDCVSSLEAWISGQVDVSASGSAMGECMNGTCEAEAEGEASASCTTVPGGPAGFGAALMGMMVAGAALGRRRRA
jgi:hypothetical protein